ncbi:hypothetical protein [Streptomyces malaysiensis]|uniref:hypothetical protein n=1 Tax=Streptomyces malaysiensis TaxID=92644 RepID=UPI0036AAB657
MTRHACEATTEGLADLITPLAEAVVETSSVFNHKVRGHLLVAVTSACPRAPTTTTT